MTRENYLDMTAVFRDHPRRVRSVVWLNRLLTGIVFVSYPLFLLYLLTQRNPWLIRAVVVPAISFAAVSLFRTVVNVPRPYERFGVPSVIPKDTKGKSFPSRHVFSVFVIAVTVFYQCPGAGLALGAAGILLAILRVVGGVHSPLDVTVGALIGIASGILGYYIL